MIRIAIADDHELIREGIKKVVQGAPDFALVGEAASLPATLELLASCSIDVLLLDLGLDHANRLESLSAVRAAFPDIPVLVLSVHPEHYYAVPALKAGAAGYVSKAMAVEQVVAAIRRIAAGSRYITPLTAELLANELSNPSGRPGHEQLTSREQEVFRLLGGGLPIKRVAAQLSISVSSVNTYRTRIFRKMGLQSNAALIRYAVEHGLAG